VTWAYEEAVAWLRSHVDHERLAGRPDPGPREAPTLDRMRRLCAVLGDPQDAQPAIHVTGTNGKGSTVRLAAALVAAMELTVGTYTSPDLGRLNERIARNLLPIPDDDLAEVVEAIAGLEALVDGTPTYFELLEAAAFRWFADIAVDVAVVEVGMGGRHDGTNVLDAAVAVVTNVGLDHAEVIGPTRADIAREKAGIVKPGATLVLGETAPGLVSIFEAERPGRLLLRDRDFAIEDNLVAVGGRSLTIRTPYARHEDVFLALHGAHQGENAATAVTAVEAFFDRALPDDVVREALATITNPGRFVVVARNPLVVLDGAHNAEGAARAGETLDDFRVEGERFLVVGLNRGRDPAVMLEALGVQLARGVIATAPDWPRAMDPHELAAAARGLGADVEVVPKVADAVRRARALAAPEDLIFVTGSLYTVGEARQALRVP
jgi:dihydrofolate synthase/folylpolyglutamate synthase